MVIYGTGEPAELAHISLRELGLEPMAVFDGVAVGHFLGIAVRPLTDHSLVAYDLMIVASLERPGPLVARLVEVGVPEKSCALRSPSGLRRMI